MWRAVFIAMTVTVRRPHKRMKTVVAAPVLTCPTATAGDGFLPRIGVRCRLFAGMTVWVCGGLFYSDDSDGAKAT